jgi:hypothetical protein
MHWLDVLTAASIGVAFATVGAHVVPPEPAREEMDRSLLYAAVVTVCACAWSLWRNELVATLLPFAAASLLLSGRRAGAVAGVTED